MSSETLGTLILALAVLLCAGEPDLYDAIMANLIGDAYEVKEGQAL